MRGGPFGRFSALTMRSVGEAAHAMVKEVARQFATIQGLADSAALDFHERKQWTQSGRKLVPHSPPPALSPLPFPLPSGHFFCFVWFRHAGRRRLTPRRARARACVCVGQTKPDYTQCIDIATTASLREMIAPGVLVILSPILVGTFGGVEAVSGLLAGAIVSSVQVPSPRPHPHARPGLGARHRRHPPPPPPDAGFMWKKRGSCGV